MGALPLRGRLTTSRPTQLRRLPAVAVSAGLLAACVLAGCSDDADPETAPTSSAPVSSAPVSTEATTAADGTTLPGTELAVGESAIVQWAPRKGDESTIRLTVTGASRGSMKELEQYELTGEARKSAVWYVTAGLTNVGRGDLSGQLPTLYGMVSDDLVVQPVSFTPPFAQCDHRPLPEGFERDSGADLCMVMLTPKTEPLQAIEWRGADETEPIRWVLP